MNKILPILFVGVLVLCGLGAVAHNNDVEEFVLNDENIKEGLIGGNKAYTHTVLVEVGTATWCGGCPATNLAWHDIYGSGDYNFEYTELVYDKNPVASSRFFEFNPAYIPTSYWDGGEYVVVGTNADQFMANIEASGSRTVPDLQANLEVEWLGDAEIEISYSILNNDASSYPGTLRIYIIELVSTLWNDAGGNPYYHAFLDFATVETIDIAAGDTLSDIIIWDGAAANYSNITEDNIQVILGVFDDDGHTSYSNPPSGNPFTAYYSDECIAVPSVSFNYPPETPTIDGPTEGEAGEIYTYEVVSTDPEDENVIYCIDFGDDTGEVCVGPFESGVTQLLDHSWEEEGTYIIRVKATDINGAESDWATLEVVMPVNRPVVAFSLLDLILQRFPNAFPVLRILFGL